jgi:hypothetical protein
MIEENGRFKKGAVPRVTPQRKTNPIGSEEGVLTSRGSPGPCWVDVYVVRKIILAPGCPDFLYDQWINIVKDAQSTLTKSLKHSP